MQLESFRVVGIFIIFTICLSLAEHQESFCGQKDADAGKTCISVRLPWQRAPIYFCTENVNIAYKERCTDHLSRYCPTEHQDRSLLVATPWDCCAMSSTPDACADRTCPSAPFNRTCRKIEPDTLSRPWDCCPSYFCEEGRGVNSSTTSTCQMKRLTPACLSPPKNKTNCVAFKDEHGCCNKFQCDGDGKPGMCPMQVQAVHFRRMMESTSPAPTNNTIELQVMATTMKTPTFMNSTRPPPQTPQTRERVIPGHGVVTDLRCVGDYNCPGQMKCCSSMMSTYFDPSTIKTFGGGSKYGSLRDTAVYGLCVEPAWINPM
ncbi:uncharacterized protein LOC110849214 [Folsomia candida]|uniref:WAP domain-containing protein n=1 Tax=Folsomia candida TaxID=158441 RepID=A0A226EJC0_FOLCA|nr:uncharacterized protein LOC110849214 [Folsomia candida]OXA56646.1 hypothetical protein Fcan01_08953 [Folsomia candida]